MAGIFTVMQLSVCKAASVSTIERTFINAPWSIQTSVYWYWLSDHISEDGVVKDLEAMKAAGINRAFIGNIGLSDMPRGKVRMFSDEWWRILHAALKKASELNIEIGLFNSPGWSQSGGPWIKPEEAMRYLSQSETEVSGPGPITLSLPKPNDCFQDVRVLAYPVLAETDRQTDRPLTVTSVPEVDGLAKIVNAKGTASVRLPSVSTLTIDIHAEKARELRAVSIYPGPGSVSAFHVRLLVHDAGGYRLIRQFDVDRTNNNLNVGFNPSGPVTVAVPDSRTASVRLILDQIKPGSELSTILLSSEPLEECFIEKSLAKMHQTPLPAWSDYRWPRQPETADSLYIHPSTVQDISRYMDASGNLKWNIPEGRWRIVRAGMTPTGVKNEPAFYPAQGLEADKMSKQHIYAHFNAFIGEIRRRIPAKDRKTWKVVVADSYETGGQNWTDDLIATFRKTYGYDPVPFIPVLNGHVAGNRDQSDRFLWDLRRLVADKVAYDYIGGLRTMAHKNGLTTWLENYGHWGFPGEFLQYGGQSDEVSGEFWSEGELGNIENRAASSCAHIYGKRKVSSESFTSGGTAFSSYPLKMKRRGDRFFTEGINNTLLHVYIEQPYDDKYPGVNAPFGNEFNRKNTWFGYLDLFTTYLKRCDYMLQQGNYVADVAYFIGEETPKMTGVCDPALPQGYSFDYINSEVLYKARVKNGKITLPGGMNYRVLVLPNQETMRPELLKKISELIRAGAVVVGIPPKRSPSLRHYPEADRQVCETARQLWGKVDGKTVQYANVGKGMIIDGMDMKAVFRLIGHKPDCLIEHSDSVLFVHRKLKDKDIYFLSNQAETVQRIRPCFHTGNMVPEWWNPVDGSVRLLPDYHSTTEGITIPIKLEPLESAFIVFRKKSSHRAMAAAGSAGTNFPEPDTLADLSTGWTVQFDPAFNGPKQPQRQDRLDWWTNSLNDSIKYYSGTAVYKKTVMIEHMPSCDRLYLELGRLSAMARVKVNGIEVGGAWTAPWHVDIKKAIRPGTNEIEISVVNAWANRLIGDSRLPEKSRKAWCLVNPYQPGSPLQPSGLAGPVYLTTVKD